MRRTVRWLATTGIIVLLSTPVAADTQPREKVYRIGFVMTSTPDEVEHLTKALEGALRELGYVKGRNIVFERRFAMGKQERLPDLAQELNSPRPFFHAQLDHAFVAEAGPGHERVLHVRLERVAAQTLKLRTEGSSHR